MQDIAAVLEQSVSFSKQLRDLKTKESVVGGWYGYDIMGNLVHLERLLAADRRRLLGSVKNRRIADIGCADGDLGFFMESLGCSVDFVDFPGTNWNGMRGVRRLKELLDSTAQVHEVNLDEYFALPSSHYELVFFLGILYHLKNPFYVLEKLARSAKHLLVSTRVFRQVPDGLSVDGRSLSYLVSADESENGDATNYWIFTRFALLRLFDRTGWEVLDFITVGDQDRSDPHSAAHDERAFALLKTRIAM
jgi:tRNA (mo5U34)-methyltransferase